MWHGPQAHSTPPAHAKSSCPWKHRGRAGSFWILDSFILHLPGRRALRRLSTGQFPPRAALTKSPLHSRAVPALRSVNSSVRNHEADVLLPGVQEPRALPAIPGGSEPAGPLPAPASPAQEVPAALPKLQPKCLQLHSVPGSSSWPVPVTLSLSAASGTPTLWRNRCPPALMQPLCRESRCPESPFPTKSCSGARGQPSHGESLLPGSAFLHPAFKTFCVLSLNPRRHKHELIWHIRSSPSSQDQSSGQRCFSKPAWPCSSFSVWEQRPAQLPDPCPCP